MKGSDSQVACTGLKSLCFGGAIASDHLTRDEAAIIRCKVTAKRSDVTGFAEMAYRNPRRLRFDVPRQFRISVLGSNRAWRDGIDRDAAGAEFFGQGFS